MTRFQITIITTLVCLAGAAAAFLYKEGRVTPEYRATTKFRILTDSVPAGAGGGTAGSMPPGNWLEGEVALLSSPPILTRVVKALGLEAEWKLTPEEAVARVQSKLEISADAGEDIVSVTGWAESADAAATLANGVRDAYRQHRTDAQFEKLSQVMRDIEKQTAEQQRIVEVNRAELEAVKKKHGIGGEETPGGASSSGRRSDAAQ